LLLLSSSSSSLEDDALLSSESLPMVCGTMVFGGTCNGAAAGGIVVGRGSCSRFAWLELESSLLLSSDDVDFESLASSDDDDDDEEELELSSSDSSLEEDAS
jgi:hypothetical protein